MLSVRQFRTEIVRPVLDHIGLHSAAAENLLVGTAVQESQLRYLRQMPSGPGLGLYQIEPRTHHDLYINFVLAKPAISDQLHALQGFWPQPDAALIGNLFYATAVARMIYYRVKEPLPHANDVEGLARYWKKHYNTHEGRGTVSSFILNYREFVQPTEIGN